MIIYFCAKCHCDMFQIHKYTERGEAAATSSPKLIHVKKECPKNVKTKFNIGKYHSIEQPMVNCEVGSRCVVTDTNSIEVSFELVET